MNKYDDTDYQIEREESIEYEEGSNTNVGSIEKDIKRCEQLTKPEHANWIGISNQLAIAHVVDRVKELEEEKKNRVDFQQKYIEVTNLYLNSIPKQKVKNRIKENKKLIDETYSEDIIQKLTDENEILEELLEDK